MRKIASLYGIIMGICMLGMWAMFCFNNQIPELATKPIEISLHLLAEGTTAVMLITSGMGLLFKKSWAYSLCIFSMGMLVYTLIQSPGYFLQSGELPIVIMFGIFLILAIVIVTQLLIKRDDLDL